MTQLNHLISAHARESITSHERLVMYCLRVRGVPMTAEAIAAELDIPAASAKRTAQTLVKAGFVARTCVGAQARYVALHPLKPIPAEEVVEE